MNRKIIMIVISIVIVISILLASTYAVFYNQYKLDNTESYTSGTLDVSIVPVNDELSLSNSMPMTDDNGKKTTAYQFKVKNNGNLGYTFDLKVVPTTTSNLINTKYIKVMVDNNTPQTLSSLNNIIVSGLKLEPSQEVVISVRMWLDITTPNSEIGKVYNAQIIGDGIGYDTNTTE